MRSAGNFHPEWGYLAPMRTVRILLVSAAIGATAGTVVVASLVPRLNSDNRSIAARALVASTPVINWSAPAASLANAPAATAPAQLVLQPKASAAANIPSPVPTAATTSAADAAALAGTRPAAKRTEALAPTPAGIGAGVARAKTRAARTYHWQVARSARNGWRYDRGFGSFFQPVHRRLIDGFGKHTFPAARGGRFGATRNDW